MAYWKTRPTEEIVDSLRPGQPEALRTWGDGRIANGNTRTLVFEGRGVDIDALPREVKVVDPNTLETTWVTRP